VFEMVMVQVKFCGSKALICLSHKLIEIGEAWSCNN
jgi:hypothetical protein